MVRRPTELLIFGNAKAGTLLMQADQATGIDLPLRSLAWEDQDQKIWLSSNDPLWLADRKPAVGPAGSAGVSNAAASA